MVLSVPVFIIDESDIIVVSEPEDVDFFVLHAATDKDSAMANNPNLKEVFIIMVF